MRVPARVYDRFSPTVRPGPYRIGDYLELSDPEERCELLNGYFYLSPAPTVAHQVVADALCRILHEIALVTGGLALSSPIDVALGENTVCQPDVVYLSKERRAFVGEARIEGAPDLLVEVLSPRTSRRDRIEKLRIYSGAGVCESWLVDPDGRTFEFLDLRDEHPVIRLAREDVYASEIDPRIRIDVRSFWQAVDDRLGRSPR